MRLLLACAAAAVALGASSPCDDTIPGLWRIPGNFANLTWSSPTTAWLGVPLKPGNHWNSVAATLSADATAVDAHFFPNKHHGLGNVSTDCKEIAWDDGSSWSYAGRMPTAKINVHMSMHTHDDVGL